MILVWALACAPAADSGDVTSPADPCRAGPEPTLEIGQGETLYEPLPDGVPEVTLVHGPQGGYHVLLALRARYLEPDQRVLAHLVGTVEGARLAESQPYLAFRCNGQTDALEAWNLYLIFDARPEDLDGRVVTVDASLTDALGTTVSATRDLLIDDPLLGG